MGKAFLSVGLRFPVCTKRELDSVTSQVPSRSDLLGVSESIRPKNVHILPTSFKAYFFSHYTELLSREVVKRENKSPVKIAFAIQGPVVDVCFLFVVFAAGNPAVKQRQKKSVRSD